MQKEDKLFIHKHIGYFMENQKKSEYDIHYQVYLSETESLVDAEKASAQQFDKAILTLAAGALAISLTFINQIAPNPKSWTLYILFSAWLTFCFSILSTLISLLTSQLACSRQREILENEFFETKQQQDAQNNPAKSTQILNWISIVSFIIGVLLLAIFSISNLSNG